MSENAAGAMLVLAIFGAVFSAVGWVEWDKPKPHLQVFFRIIGIIHLLPFFSWLWAQVLL